MNAAHPIRGRGHLSTLALAVLLAALCWGCVWPSEFTLPTTEDADANDLLDVDAPSDTTLGACAGECLPGYQCCTVGEQSGCVLTSADVNHCGFCNNACADGARCEGGSCTQDCGAGLASCAQRCVELSSDESHCGACGAACLPGETCEQGVCQCVGAAGTQPQTCTDPQVCCPDQGCKNLAVSPKACGACGQGCGPGETCAQGSCVCGTGPACGDGASCCDGSCCVVGELCCEGLCKAPEDATCQCGAASCGATESCCASPVGEVCVDTNASPLHCGACDGACATNETCADGECTCGGGFGDCDVVVDGCETSLLSSHEHCGACGQACEQGEACVNGVCDCDGAACAIGEACCGGACVDLNTSSTHCGACISPCPSPPSGSHGVGVVCTSGTCSLSCEEGYGDCDHDPANGCEVSLYDDHDACGTCNTPCDPQATCAKGSCSCTGSCQCVVGEAYCNGACVDPATDELHCGGCNAPCASGRSCVGGLCVCPGGQSACGGKCVNTATDPSNCGACGHVCANDPHAQSGTCSSGACTYTCDSDWSDCDPAQPGCETGGNGWGRCW